MSVVAEVFIFYLKIEMLLLFVVFIETRGDDERIPRARWVR